jgi:hypothetical protein
MYSLIPQLFFECTINHLMLFHEPFALEGRRYDKYLPVISATGQVLHLDSGTRERLFQYGLDFLGCNHMQKLTGLILTFQLSQAALLIAFSLWIEIASDLFHHRPQIHAQLIQSRPADVPVAAIDIMHGQIR